MHKDRGARLPLRTFVDDEYDNWRVYEVVAPGERGDDRAGRGADRSLIFETDRLFRRVRHYPTEWVHLSAEELRALSWLR